MNKELKETLTQVINNKHNHITADTFGINYKTESIEYHILGHRTNSDTETKILNIKKLVYNSYIIERTLTIITTNRPITLLDIRSENEKEKSQDIDDFEDLLKLCKSKYKSDPTQEALAYLKQFTK